MSHVTVVCGVIEHKGRILIGRQIEGEHPAGLGGKWLFPGGRVEEDESIGQALKREIKEETNLCIDMREQLGQYIDRRTGAKVLFFRCVPITHAATASDDLQEVKWVEKREVLKNLDESYIRTLPLELIALFEVGL